MIGQASNLFIHKLINWFINVLLDSHPRGRSFLFCGYFDPLVFFFCHPWLTATHPPPRACGCSGNSFILTKNNWTLVEKQISKVMFYLIFKFFDVIILFVQLKAECHLPFEFIRTKILMKVGFREYEFSPQIWPLSFLANASCVMKRNSRPFWHMHIASCLLSVPLMLFPNTESFEQIRPEKKNYNVLLPFFPFSIICLLERHLFQCNPCLLRNDSWIFHFLIMFSSNQIWIVLFSDLVQHGASRNFSPKQKVQNICHFWTNVHCFFQKKLEGTAPLFQLRPSFNIGEIKPRALSLFLRLSKVCVWSVFFLLENET